MDIIDLKSNECIKIIGKIDDLLNEARKKLDTGDPSNSYSDLVITHENRGAIKCLNRLKKLITNQG